MGAAAPAVAPPVPTHLQRSVGASQAAGDGLASGLASGLAGGLAGHIGSAALNRGSRRWQSVALGNGTIARMRDGPWATDRVPCHRDLNRRGGAGWPGVLSPPRPRVPVAIAPSPWGGRRRSDRWLETSRSGPHPAWRRDGCVLWRFLISRCF